MKALLIIIIGLALSWHFTDISSDSAARSVLAPIGLAVFLISLCIWLVFRAGFGKSLGRGGLGDSFFDGDGGGGD